MKIHYRSLAYGPMLLLFAGCTTTLPTGPSVAVMPAPGKPFEVFAEEDRICRQYAEQSVGMNVNETAKQNAVESAVTGAAIGATAGALLGEHEGAGAGAAMGLIAGSAAGSDQAAYAQRTVQQRYDIAYEQCMYAKGNQIPGYRYRQQAAPPPPPPPPGTIYRTTPPPPPRD